MFMATEPALTPIEGIETKIHFIRGQRVMLDSDLARIYGVQLKRLNEQVGRNAKRFPGDFAFQLTREELANLKSQFATSRAHGGKRKLPWVFTEYGAIMLAGVLNSQRAVEMSVFVVRAFVRMREMLMSNRQLAAKLDELEKRVTGHDEVIGELVAAIRELLNPGSSDSKREIGFHVKEDAIPYRIRRRT
ncbi:MAG: ORF6N domain-containing protein [Verrucomicrobiales bacterium]|nr:ORF6N domain-containing protein [Verrucomicrobiales bacterium]